MTHPTSNRLTPEKLAEYKELLPLGRFCGVGGDALKLLLDEIEACWADHKQYVEWASPQLERLGHEMAANERLRAALQQIQDTSLDVPLRVRSFIRRELSANPPPFPPETKSPPAPDLQTRCNHGRIVHATWICPECSAEHERDSNAEEIPQRCICGHGKYYHPWRFCDNYRPVPKTPAPSAQETTPSVASVLDSLESPTPRDAPKCYACGQPRPDMRAEKASTQRCPASTGETGCVLVDGHPGPHQFRQQFQSNGLANATISNNREGK